MPLYIDVHKKVEGLTAEGAMAAHARDLAVEGKYGVKYIKYWYDESTGMIFCFAEAPSKEAAEAVHRGFMRHSADAADGIHYDVHLIAGAQRRRASETRRRPRSTARR